MPINCHKTQIGQVYPLTTTLAAQKWQGDPLIIIIIIIVGQHVGVQSQNLSKLSYQLKLHIHIPKHGKTHAYHGPHLPLCFGFEQKKTWSHPPHVLSISPPTRNKIPYMHPSHTSLSTLLAHGKCQHLHTPEQGPTMIKLPPLMATSHVMPSPESHSNQQVPTWRQSLNFRASRNHQSMVNIIKVKSLLFYAKISGHVLWVVSSFMLNPTLNTSPEPHLQTVLPCRHPCRTWDLGLGTPCELVLDFFLTHQSTHAHNDHHPHLFYMYNSHL